MYEALFNGIGDGGNWVRSKAGWASEHVTMHMVELVVFCRWTMEPVSCLVGLESCRCQGSWLWSSNL
jgi:hypothetical protein